MAKAKADEEKKVASESKAAEEKPVEPVVKPKEEVKKEGGLRLARRISMDSGASYDQPHAISHPGLMEELSSEDDDRHLYRDPSLVVGGSSSNDPER